MAELLEYKCPCCGGAVEFNSGLQRMKCPFCDTEFSVEEFSKSDAAPVAQEGENEPEWEDENNAQWNIGEDGLITYVCNSCGGEIIGDENMGASSCPYCGNPIVIKEQFSGTLKPDFVIPFKLDKKAAKERLKQHYSGKRLLPKAFRNENHIDEIKGIYVPFWLFDSTAYGSANFKGTKVRHWEDKVNRYTETSYFNIYREGSLSFKNVPVDGSKKMKNSVMESIEPFDFREAVDFKTAYLAGYLADKYDVTADECKPRAKERMRNSTVEAFRGTVEGYATVNEDSSLINFAKSSVRYTLCPVWILNTTWNNEKYTFAMNGQTGKFVGDLPLDKSEYWKWFALVTGITTAAVTALSYIIYLL